MFFLAFIFLLVCAILRCAHLLIENYAHKATAANVNNPRSKKAPKNAFYKCLTAPYDLFNSSTDNQIIFNECPGHLSIYTCFYFIYTFNKKAAPASLVHLSNPAFNGWRAHHSISFHDFESEKYSNFSNKSA